MAMWTNKWQFWRFLLCSLLFIGILGTLVQDANAEEQDLPSESQCRPYIEKALKDLETGDTHSVSEEGDTPQTSAEDTKEEVDEDSSVEILNDEPVEDGQDDHSVEVADEPYVNEVDEGGDEDSNEKSGEDTQEAGDSREESNENDNGGQSVENQETDSGENTKEDESGEASEQQGDSKEALAEDEAEKDDADGDASAETKEDTAEDDKEDSGEKDDKTEEESKENEADDSKERVKRDVESDTEEVESKEGEDSKEEEVEAGSEGESKEQTKESKENEDSTEKDTKSEEEGGDSKEQTSDSEQEQSKEQDEKSTETTEDEEKEKSVEEEVSKEEAEIVEATNEGTQEEESDKEDSKEEAKDESKEGDDSKSEEDTKAGEESEEKEQADAAESEDSGSQEAHPEEDLLMEIEIPENLRSKDHITQILRLDDESTEAEILIEKSADIVLRELKRLYDNAIKPLEILYKYRDLSNRHFGDPEIFSKPLVLFMGPWSGGKSSLINYLTDNEFSEWSLRTGAEPSPAYFNILMHGNEPQVLDGTQLAADWTFSGLQKFGQGLEERLRGLKLPSKLLEKVNIVEIPGILEVRKQVSRVFPFNDACQWFIDRADIIFLVYDPSKLDVGPETEAILDQLKGRESQTRILLNKADQVKPEELMRVQSALIWNISPLMSSAQPPVMYTTSLWSLPYESGAPARLLQAQEKAFLKDLREAVDKRVDNKIASARRFAVRVRNHAKMVDCYLTTYYNHKTIFANKKVVAEAIIEHPQNYHIYEGLSTLTNISRYDLPDPETYRDFFRLNPLYDFQQLSATCTYFRGCPINRLDIAIAYDLPELVGKYKKMVESATPQGMPKS